MTLIWGGRWLITLPSWFIRILLVSQDRDELYITIGTLDRHYLKGLKGTNKTLRFLELTRYGPWSIWNANDIEQVSEIILAFALRAMERR